MQISGMLHKKMDVVAIHISLPFQSLSVRLLRKHVLEMEIRTEMEADTETETEAEAGAETETETERDKVTQTEDTVCRKGGWYD